MSQGHIALCVLYQHPPITSLAISTLSTRQQAKGGQLQLPLGVK